MILRAQRVCHTGVLLEQPEADDSPVATAGRELLYVHREVCPVEAADPDMDEARSEPVAVVAGDRNSSPGDLGELCLAETDDT